MYAKRGKMAAIELYHAWDSLQSFKVRLCLAELGLAWQSHPLCLTDFDHLRPDYLAINPSGLVPALRHGDDVILESSIINAFLDERFGQSRLHPGDAAARARMRWWCHFEDTVVHPAIRPPTFNLYIKTLVASPGAGAMEPRIAGHPLPERAAAYRAAATEPFDEAAVIAAIQALDRIIDRMEAALARRDWLACDRFTLADVAMAALVDRLEMLRLDDLWQGRERAARWAAAVRERPAFAAARGASAPGAAIDPALTRRLMRDARLRQA